MNVLKADPLIYVIYLTNWRLIALPALGKVILVLKRYLSSCLKEGRRPLAICAPWTGGKLKWSIINLAFERFSPTLWLWNIFNAFKCVNDKQIEICQQTVFVSCVCYVILAHEFRITLRPRYFQLKYQLFRIRFFRTPSIQGGSQKKIWCQCFEVISVDLCCPWPKINPVSVFQTPVQGRVER